MKVTFDIYPLAEQLPEVGDVILAVTNDGFFDCWTASTVTRSIYSTPFEIRKEGCVLYTRYPETSVPINKDSVPYVQLESGVILRNGYYMLLSNINLTNPELSV